MKCSAQCWPQCHFRDKTDAIRLANGTEYGLVASVWTENGGRGLHGPRHQKQGGCSSTTMVRAAAWSCRFGGVKSSGYGREKGFEGAVWFQRHEDGGHPPRLIVRRHRSPAYSHAGQLRPKMPVCYPRSPDQRHPRVLRAFRRAAGGGIGRLAFGLDALAKRSQLSVRKRKAASSTSRELRDVTGKIRRAVRQSIVLEDASLIDGYRKLDAQLDKPSFAKPGACRWRTTNAPPSNRSAPQRVVLAAALTQRRADAVSDRDWRGLPISPTGGRRLRPCWVVSLAGSGDAA